MITRSLSVFFLLIIFMLPAAAQPGTSNKTLSIPAKDNFCDSLQLIINNSASGFIDFRYNGKQVRVTTIYTTTLPGLGFQRKFVQIGLVSPYKRFSMVTLPYFIVNSGFSDPSKADRFFTRIKQKLLVCIKPEIEDSIPFAGYKRYAKFQLSKPEKDSFVTVELILLSSPHAQSVILRIFHNRGSMKREKASLPSDPSTNSGGFLNRQVVSHKDAKDTRNIMIQLCALRCFVGDQ